MKTITKNISLLLAMLFLAQTISAQYVVTNVNDSGYGSLRDAVAVASASAASSYTISFSLPSGNNIITLNSELVLSSTVSKSVSINGNNASNPSSKVILRGTGSRAIYGLRIPISSIYSFSIDGIQFENFDYALFSYASCFIGGIGSGSIGNVFVNNNRSIYINNNTSAIKGNYIGVDRNFNPSGNYMGIECTGNYADCDISSNFICKNDYGIFAYGGTVPITVSVANNIFGTNNDAATTNLGNITVFYGSTNSGGSSNVYFEGNTIAYSTGTALVLDKFEFRRNNFYCNMGTVISPHLPSYPIAAPFITSVVPNQYGGVTISGTAHAAYDSIYIFQRDPSVCSAAPCQGFNIGGTVSDANKNWTLYVNALPGKQLTAMATVLGGYLIGLVSGVTDYYVVGSSSVFSTCATIPCPSVVVNFTTTQNVYCNGGNDGTAQLSIVPNGYTYFSFNYQVTNATTNAVVATAAVSAFQSTPAVISGLSAGKYNVTITNPINGCTYTASTTVTEPSSPLSMNSCKELTPVSSVNATDAVGQVTVSGGTPPYSLSVLRPNGTSFNVAAQATGVFNIPNLSPGTYTVTAFDNLYANAGYKLGCKSTCTFTINTPNCTALKVSVAQTNNVLCYGGTGSVKIKYVDLAVNFPLTLTLGSGYSQTIAGFSADSTVTIPNLSSGTYTISLKNRVNCQVTSSVTVTQPSLLSISCNLTTTNAKRVGEASGSQQVLLSGGVPPYMLSLGGDETRIISNIPISNYTIPNLKAGNYTVKLIDANGCTTQPCSFTIKDPDCSTFKVSLVADSIRCYGENNGKITTTTTYGVAPYTYQWNNAAIGNQAIASNLDVGVYTVTVTDDRYCTNSASATIYTPSVLTTTVTKTDATIVGAANGTASVTISGGTPSYSLTLTKNGTLIPLSSRVGNTFSFNNLSKGTYISYSKDAKGCSKTDTVLINDPNCNFAITAKADSTSCYASADGRILVSNNNNNPLVTVDYVWSSALIANTATATGLSAGSYSVTATTSQNCKDSATVKVYEPNSIQITPTPHDVTTVGGTDGRINLTVTGGTQPYSVKIAQTLATKLTANSFVFNNLAKGTYTIIVTDTKGCTKNVTVTLAEPTCNITLDKQVDSVKCKGGSTGRIAIGVLNSVGALTYTWSASSVGNSAVANNLPAGIYSVTVTDSQNCTANLSTSVYEPTALSSSYTSSQVTTFNGNNGSIQVTVNGGTQAYTVVRGNNIAATRISATSFIFSNLPKGTYTYTVTDAKGCATSQTVTITEPNCTIVLTKNSTNITCNGLSNGSASVTITGGVKPLKILWSNQATTATINNLSIGTYTVTVTDSINCTNTSSMTISEPPALSSNVVSTNVTRVGANNGTINLTAIGGTPNYTLNMLLGNANITPTTQSPPQYNFTNLAGGTYQYTLTDSKNCTKTGAIIITEPICSLKLTTPVIDSVGCNGGSNGRIALSSTGASGGITYIWTPSSIGNTSIASNLKAGTYTVKATDTLGCTANATMQVSEPAVLTSTPSVTNVSTTGGSNGSIQVTVSGGTQAYTVVRGSDIAIPATRISATSFIFSNLPKGTYIYTVIDAKGCTTSQTVTITEPNCTIVLTKNSTNITCNGLSNGSASVTITGGVKPLKILWSNQATTATINNLSIGTYTVTVTDSINCTNTSSMTISEPPALSSNVVSTNVTRVGANNGTINLTAIGGTPNYTLNMLLGNANITPTTQSPPQYNFTNLAGGTYQYTLTDSKNCTKTGAIIITEPICSLKLTTPVIDSVGCNGGSNGRIALTSTGASGGITYIWTPSTIGNTSIASNLKAGTYTVKATDTLGCTANATMQVSEPAVLTSTPAVTNVSTTGGNNGSIQVTVSGGTQAYTVVRGSDIAATRISATSFMFSNLPKGTYTYTVTDAKGCTTSQTVTVNDPTCNLKLTSQVDSVLCKGDATGRIVITPTGGVLPYTFVWNPTSLGTTNTASNLKSGSYTVLVTDSVRCTTTQTIPVGEPNGALSSTSTTTPTTTTNGTDGTLILIVSGGSQGYTVRSGTLTAVRQSASSFIFNNLKSGDYAFTVTDVRGCSTTGTATVGTPNCNVSIQTQIDSVKCKGDATGRISVITTNTVGNVSYTWSLASIGNIPSPANLAAGTYSFTVTDGRNCAVSRTVQVFEPLVLISKNTKSDVSSVSGTDGQISVVALGGTPPYSVNIGTTAATLIRPDSFVFKNLSKGNYTYILKDANGCQVSQSVMINDPGCNVAAQLTVKQPISCFGMSDGQLELSVQNVQTPQYSWNQSSIGNIQNPSNLKAGLYIVTVTDGGNCSATAQIQLAEPPQIKAMILGDTSICQGQSTSLRFSVENVSNFIITYTNGVDTLTTTTLQATITPPNSSSYKLVSIKSGVCSGVVSTNNVQIEVRKTSIVATIKATKDSLCEGGTVTLFASGLATRYIWKRPAPLSDTTTTDILTILNATARDSGEYSVQLNQSGCLSASSAPVKVNVITKPKDQANAGADKTECDATVTTLSASAVSSRNLVGRWITVNSSVVLAQPTSNTTTATNLSTGINQFVWILSNNVCGETSRDSVTISVGGKPEIDGVPQLVLEFPTVLINTRELLKDKIGDPSLFSVKVTKKPDGVIVDSKTNGIYFDRNTLTDGQTVEIEFEICSKICPSVCNHGKMNIILKSVLPEDSLVVPKIYSINNRTGESMEIGGLDFYLDNEITIVDRWGTTVFGPTDYKNGTPEKSWNGTRKGELLPTGAYYYFMKYKSNVVKIKNGIIYLVEEK